MAHSSEPKMVWSKLGALALLIAACVLFANLLRDQRFHVARVEISGLDLVDGAEVMSRLDLAGKPVFAVRAHSLEAVIETQLPLVEHVRIRGVLPNIVRVRVTEKRAIVAWESGGRYWWIGDGGRVLGRTGDPRGRPVIHDVKSLDPDPADYVLGVPWDLARAVAAALAPGDRLEYGLEEGLIATKGAGHYAVLIGTEGDARQKMAIAADLERLLADRRLVIEYIDVRTEQRPSVRLR